MIEKLLANPFAGDGTLHPDLHLIYVDEVCGLFNLAGLPDDVIKKKVFPLSLKGDALTWYRLCDDMGSWNYKRLKLEFHQKFYPMHLVHRDRNYIYNFWPREGESIAQAWGRLKSMLYLCPNHELQREIYPVTKLSVTTYFSTCREYLAENRLSFPSAPRWVRHSYLSKGLR